MPRACACTQTVVFTLGLCAHCMHTALISPAAASTNHTTHKHTLAHTMTPLDCTHMTQLTISQLLSAGMLVRVMNVNPTAVRQHGIYSRGCSAKSGQSPIHPPQRRPVNPKMTSKTSHPSHHPSTQAHAWDPPTACSLSTCPYNLGVRGHVTVM